MLPRLRGCRWVKPWLIPPERTLLKNAVLLERRARAYDCIWALYPAMTVGSVSLGRHEAWSWLDRLADISAYRGDTRGNASHAAALPDAIEKGPVLFACHIWVAQVRKVAFL